MGVGETRYISMDSDGDQLNVLKQETRIWRAIPLAGTLSADPLLGRVGVRPPLSTLVSAFLTTIKLAQAHITGHILIRPSSLVGLPEMRPKLGFPTILSSSDEFSS